MLRILIGVITGVVTWVVLITVAGAIMRASWPEYAAVADSMIFTLPMMIARLSLSAVALLIAARLTRAIAPQSSLAPMLVGVVLLVAFIPVHINLWSKFPVWYHLTFLLTLIPLSILGGKLGMSRKTENRATATI